jgi:L-alanine-DL-glutamate epimerase-like enolase superfamily enzyme
VNRLPVDEVSVALYRKALPAAITNGVATQTHAHRDGARQGGWARGVRLGGSETVWQAAQELAPLVVGSDALCTERVWTAMYRPKVIGRRGLTTRAVRAVDIALWDLKAKALELPLWRLLGGHADRIRGYVAGGHYTAGGTLASLAEEMRHNAELGARAVKMKIGVESVERDLERVRAVRAEVGDGVDILVDANGCYRTDEARHMARCLADLGVFWFEEPVSWENTSGYAWLRRDGHVRIAGGENE